MGWGPPRAQSLPMELFTDFTESSTNRILHFALELTVWGTLGAWGWRHGGWTGWLLAAALPLLIIVSWNAFAVPHDPWLPGGRDGDQPWVDVPGWVRLAYEAAVHGLAAWLLVRMGHPQWAVVFATGFLVHYAVSYQRVLWLFRV